MPRPRILVVDDKEPMLELLTTILASYEVVAAASGPRAALALRGPPFDVALVDVRLPGDDGHEILKAVKACSPDTEVVMMTAYATIPDAVAGMREGAFDYLEKPFDPDDVNLVVARALQSRRHRLSAAAQRIEGQAAGGEPGASTVSMSYREAAEAGRERASRAYLAALLRELDGNVTCAAERAGMERESLHRLLRRFGIHAQDFKRAPRHAAEAPGYRADDAP